MNLVMAIVVGGLYAAGLYLMMRRSLIKVLLGLALLGHAANLLLFTVGGVTRGRPAIVPAGASAPIGPHADPLPQALILTAIVIGFGVTAFAVALVHRTRVEIGTDDPDHTSGEDQ